MHFVHETSWQAYASLKVNDTSKNEWYQALQYSDSIYNVIANAIADCKMQRNEFDKRNSVYGSYANLILFSVGQMSKSGYEFARHNPEFFQRINEKRYTPENWNALVLYNFLEEAIHKGLGTEIQGSALFTDACIEAVGEVLKRAEGKYGHSEEIDRAVSDIKEYANALGLYKYLKEISDFGSANEYYSNIIIEQDTEDGYTDTRRIKVRAGKVKDTSGGITDGEITILYNDKDKVLYKLQSGADVVLSSDLKIKEKIDATDPIRSYIKDIEDSTEDQDTEYMEERRNIVSILNAIDTTTRLKRAVKRLARTTAEPNRYATLSDKYNDMETKARTYIAKIIANYMEAETNHEKAKIIKILENRLKHIFSDITDIREMTVGDLMMKVMDALHAEEQTKLPWARYVTDDFRIYKREYIRTKPDRKGNTEYDTKYDYKNYITMNNTYKSLQEQINEELDESDYEWSEDEKRFNKFKVIEFPDILICVSDSTGADNCKQSLEKSIKMGHRPYYEDQRKMYNLVSVIQADTASGQISAIRISGDSDIPTMGNNQYCKNWIAIYEKEEEPDAAAAG